MIYIFGIFFFCLQLTHYFWFINPLDSIFRSMIPLFVRNYYAIIHLLFLIITGLFEPPVRTLRATIPAIESQSKIMILLLPNYLLGRYL